MSVTSFDDNTCEHKFLKFDHLSFERFVKHLREFAQNATMTAELLSIKVDYDVTVRLIFASLTASSISSE